MTAPSSRWAARSSPGTSRRPAGRRPRPSAAPASLSPRLFVALLTMPPTTVDLADADQARALAREAVVPLIL